MTLSEFFSIENLSTLESLVFFVSPIIFIIVGDGVVIPLRRRRIRRHRPLGVIAGFMWVMFHVLKFGMVMTAVHYTLMMTSSLPEPVMLFIGIAAAIVYWICDMLAEKFFVAKD